MDSNYEKFPSELPELHGALRRKLELGFHSFLLSVAYYYFLTIKRSLISDVSDVFNLLELLIASLFLILWSTKHPISIPLCLNRTNSNRWGLELKSSLNLLNCPFQIVLKVLFKKRLTSWHPTQLLYITISYAKMYTYLFMDCSISFRCNVILLASALHVWKLGTPKEQKFYPFEPDSI